MSSFKRITRSSTRPKHDDADTENDNENDHMSEDENPEDNEDEGELYQSEGEDGEELEVDEEDNEEVDEELTKPSKKPTPKQRAEKTMTKKEMKTLYRTREEVIQYRDTPTFRRSVIGFFVKVVSGKDEYIAQVKDVTLSDKVIKITGALRSPFTLTVESPSYTGSRMVTLAEISNTSFSNSNYDTYIKDATNNNFNILKSKDARVQARILQTLEEYKPTEEEEKEAQIVSHMVYGTKIEAEDVKLKKGKDNEEETVGEKSAKTNAMEIEEPERKDLYECKINEEIIREMEESIKMCNEMENHMIYDEKEHDKVVDVCNDFFKTFKMPETPILYQQQVVVSCEKDPKSGMTEDVLNKYL
ncbi:hypothetical protein EIN_091990 [Entamoeba invadens IP1]|uniref:Plus3 domain-containing protein n=1 Tax=Entamoeba invadens IP1 TaxID=370355 RepID=A0A0A1TYR0_ENTIV|nr:hypothetical protein EIN_091990 [Entamoeba invadens IP1]ELP86634.1 hypothetical protein EIN_091990 [Entamoeba invadens IP1]|eukprot:XP_004185980.1 hypothetical protein EIN_091990 [Entamoeba invadens IP1]